MKEYKQQWQKEHHFDKCYLFFGEETYLCKQYEQILKTSIVSTDTEDMNFDEFSEKRISVPDIISAVETLPFFHDKRLIFVRNSGFFEKNAKKTEIDEMITCIKELPEYICLVFIEEIVDKTTKLYKEISKQYKILEFSPPKENELIRWLQSIAKKSNMTISSGNAIYLIRMTEDSMENLYHEMQKLISYKGKSGELTKQDIDAVCTISIEARVFDLMKYVAQHDVQKVILCYHQLLSMQESASFLLILLARQFRMMLWSKFLLEECATTAQITKILEVREFQAKQYIQQCKQFSTKTLKQALRDCVQTDLDIKTGKCEKELAVEVLLVQYSKKL